MPPFYELGLGAPTKEVLPRPLKDLSKAIEMSRKGLVGLHKMGHYHLGASGAAVGQMVATPGFIRDEIDRLWADVISVGREIRAEYDRLNCNPTTRDESQCGKLNDFLLNVWTPYVTTVEKFRLDHKGFFSRFWGATHSTTQRHRKRLIDLHARAKSLGVGFRGPPPSPPEKTIFTKFFEGLKGLVYVALAIGGSYLAIKTLRDAGYLRG